MKYFKIFEDYENFKNSITFSKIAMCTEDAFDLIDYRDSYDDLYPGFEESEESDENVDCYYQSKEQAYESVNFMLDIFESLPNPTPIYRTISVESLDDIRHDDLGECWSFEESSALAFGSHIRATVLMSALVLQEDVDWQESVKLHFAFSGGFSGDDENEVRVINPENIQNLEVKWIGKKPSV